MAAAKGSQVVVVAGAGSGGTLPVSGVGEGSSPSAGTVLLLLLLHSEFTAGSTGLSEVLRECGHVVDQGSSTSGGFREPTADPTLLAATCLVINCESLSRIIVEYCWSGVVESWNGWKRLNG